MADLSLERVNALGDFLTDEVYEVQFVSIPSGFSGITAEDINLRCNGFSIPDTPVNYIDVTLRTFSKKQPTHRPNVVQMTMNMVESSNPKTLPFVRDWMNRCALKGSNFVYPEAQRQCEIMVYHKKNNKTVAWVYNFKNVQIETKGEISLSDGSSPGVITPQLTLNAILAKEGPSIADMA